MSQIHSLTCLPEQGSINSVARFSDYFMEKDFDYLKLIKSLKALILDNNFMVQQDHWHWVKTRGMDYCHNPKLFAYAPLTYVCAFLSELFKNFTVEQIKSSYPADVLRQALLRLKSFIN
jgi:hypothetical protein